LPTELFLDHGVVAVSAGDTLRRVELVIALQLDAATLLAMSVSSLIDTSSLEPRLIGVAIRFRHA
jgi:hypothetical protein